MRKRGLVWLLVLSFFTTSYLLTVDLSFTLFHENSDDILEESVIVVMCHKKIKELEEMLQKLNNVDGIENAHLLFSQAFGKCASATHPRQTRAVPTPLTESIDSFERRRNSEEISLM